MNTNQKIELLRAAMKSHEVEAVIIPSNDPHQSEYSAHRWKGREWISGFTGSAGTIMVTQDHAGLWTDSRYYIQGEQELSGTCIALHKAGKATDPTYTDWILDNFADGAKVAIDGNICSLSQKESLEKKLSKKNIDLVLHIDFMQIIWDGQPSIPTNEIFVHDVMFAGETRTSKLQRIREKMAILGVDYHLIGSLDDIAWLFNIRGSDVDFNPVPVAYTVIHKDKAVLYILPEKLTAEVKETLEKDGVDCKNYNDIIGDLNNLPENKTILIDATNCNVNNYKAINCKKKRGKTLSTAMKAIKNEREMAHNKNALVKDGVALAHAFFWLEELLKTGKTCTEADFGDVIAKCRSQQHNYIGESFPAIVGYKGNGAIIHYRPLHGKCDEIRPEGILLCDSGGQFLDGTTDITRTIALSPPSQEEKRNFTLVLKGHIELARAQFPDGTTGGQLDVLARKHLWEHGLNYGHGTGHGVGFFLNVHEGPQGFAPPSSPRANTKLETGMFTSNEPGYYKQGAYGIRIENLVFTVPSTVDGFLEFETVTLYPIDVTLIDENILTKSEKVWLNQYHNKVLREVSPHLEGEVKNWFELKCRGLN